MRRSLALVALVGAVLVVGGGGCRARGAARTADLDATAGTGAPLPLPAEVAAAEVLLRRLDTDGAIRLLEASGGISADAPARSWMLVDLLVARGRTREARERTRALPPGPVADVLASHAERDPERRRARIRRAFVGTGSVWAHLEAATIAAEEGGAPDAVRGHTRRAGQAEDPFVRREAALLAAREALEADRGEEAAREAEVAAQLDPADPRAPALRSRIAARRGRRDEAVLAAIDALRLAPASPRAARRVADFLREDPSPDVERRAQEAVRALVGSPNSGAEVEALAGWVAERTGDVRGAIARYRAALARGADPVPVDQRLRVLSLRIGDVAGGVALWRRAVPPTVFDDPENLLAPAWANLFARAAALPSRTPTVSRTALVELARAFLPVGGVEEAEALLEGETTPEAVALRARCLEELRFERALRRAVEDGYRAPAEGRAPPTFAALLATMRDLARTGNDPERAAAFAVPAAGSRSMPFLGEWLDHSVDTTSPVVGHFRRFGRYAMVGRRAGNPPEVILFSCASLARRARIRTQGVELRHDVAVGYDRSLRAYVDFQGGVLSGAALPDGLWLDADASRREEHGLRSLLTAPGLGPALDAAAADPSPPDGPEGTLATDEPGLLVARLVRRYVARRGDDPWGSFDVLRCHEQGHVLDLARHLPVGKGLPATAALLVGEGFAFGRVEARLEGRAQLAAVRDARDPDLALVDLVRGFPSVERAPEAHERGYRAVAHALLRRLAARLDTFPAVDGARKLLPQLDRLSPEEIRELAEDVARGGFTIR